MKFFLPLLFITTPLLACLESDLNSASYPLNCNSLTINSEVDLTNVSSPIIINVTGDVSINGQIIVSGQNGTLLSGGGAGGPGGPGGTDGGGYDNLFGPLPGNGSSGGGEGLRDFVNCGDGGAGGGFATLGNDGKPCQGSALSPSVGGAIYSDLTNIEATFSGGYGGGAGGVVDDNSVAAGGGGGGAIYIIAGGKITLSAKASILANGGNGASSINENGAGGGGSGGVIILEAEELDIQGKLSALGGKGGRAPNGGHGGNGSNGLIRLRDVEGTEDFIGIRNPILPKELKLDSNISCGTVAYNNEEENKGTFLFQILAPLFALVFSSHLRRKAQDLL